MKVFNSKRVFDLLIHNTKPINLYKNLLTICHTDKKFEIKRDLLKKITIKNYNVDLASLPDKKIMYDVAKEMIFDVKAPGKKSKRDRTIRRLLRTPSLMVSASGVSSSHKRKSSSKARNLSSDPDDLCDRIKLLLQEKHARNNFDIINEEIVAIVDKLLQYIGTSTKQQKLLLSKCLN